MTQPASGIPYSPENVQQRAYSRIAELMMQLDQLASAYETQSLELARTRERLAEATAKASAEATAAESQTGP